MKLPKRRIIWIASLLIGILLLVTARSTVGADNILQESQQIPFGILFLLIAVVVALADVVKTMFGRKSK